MMKIAFIQKIILFTLIFSCASVGATAQSTQEQSGWIFFLNGTKFNNKWGMHLDVQLRTHDEWNGLKNFIFRPGLTYHLSSNQNITLGYFLGTTTFDQNTISEHRIWEQYIISHPALKGNLSHRFRLEQRFIPDAATDSNFFAQRFRYFIRHMQPLKPNEGTFTKGPFIALQNELFFNVQNKDKLNGKFFDQNRAYLAAGVRFSKKFDAELGYMYQFVDGRAINTSNNIVQLALYTRF